MRSYPLLLWFSTAMALLGSLQFGFHIAVLNTSLPFVLDTLDIPSSRGALAVSAVLFGALFGALGAGNLADKLGPKKATVVNTLPLALGSLICAFAPNELWLILGRLLVGIGTGAASLYVPRYLTEIAPTPIRGLLATLNQICINIGIVIAFSLGFPYEDGSGKFIHVLGYSLEWWRVMFAIGMVPGVVQAIGMAVCPETPVWLLWAGLHLQASKSYRMLHGVDHEEESALVIEEERQEYVEGQSEEGQRLDEPLLETSNRAGNAAETAPAEGFKALFEPRYRKIMLLAAGLPLLQQFGGINTVILYGSEVFRTAGVKSPILANLSMGLLNTLATIVAAFLMDKSGRKALLTLSFTGMAAALGAMAAFLLLPTPEAWASRVALVSILTYIVFFALGCGPVPWVYLPEVLPPAIKGPAQALCTALNWGGNLVVGATFPSMLRLLGLGGSYAVYSVFCAVAAAFCAKYMVETKRRSLAAVHAELMR